MTTPNTPKKKKSISELGPKLKDLLTRSIELPLWAKCIRTSLFTVLALFLLFMIVVSFSFGGMDNSEDILGNKHEIWDIQSDIRTLESDGEDIAGVSDIADDATSEPTEGTAESETDSKTRFTTVNLFPRTSAVDQNILIYPSAKKENHHQMLIWDDNDYTWNSNPFPFCYEEFYCSSTGVANIRDINDDGYLDIEVRNWVTGLGGHWRNIYFVYEPSTNGFRMAEFTWTAEAISKCGTTFSGTENREMYSLWQSNNSGQGIVIAWNEFGQIIDQMYTDKYTFGYEVFFGPVEKGSSKFEIIKVVEITKETESEEQLTEDQLTRKTVYEK